MTMCAGVQKVSRPIVECHEMSQSSPIGRHATPQTATHPCQGMEPPVAGRVLIGRSVASFMRRKHGVKWRSQATRTLRVGLADARGAFARTTRGGSFVIGAKQESSDRY